MQKDIVSEWVYQKIIKEHGLSKNMLLLHVVAWFLTERSNINSSKPWCDHGSFDTMGNDITIIVIHHYHDSGHSVMSCFVFCDG